MSGKTARRLRKMAEDCTGKEIGNVEYRDVYVAGNNPNRPEGVSQTVRIVDRKTARAFYQKAKKIGMAELNRNAKQLQRDYKKDQVELSKRVAADIKVKIGTEIQRDPIGEFGDA